MGSGRTPLERLAIGSDLVVFAVVAVGYAVLASSSFHLFGALTLGVTFFPPAGLTFACFVLLPWRRWPPVVAAIVVAELSVDWAMGLGARETAGWALANTVQPMIGALIARRLAAEVGVNARFSGPFVVGGLIAGPAVGATIATINLALITESTWHNTWIDTWTGDALGVLVMAPLVIGFATSTSLPEFTRRRHEMWIGALLVTASSVVFLTTDEVPVGYVVIPLLGWSALRFGPRGLSVMAAIVAVVTTAATARGRGPWAAGSTAEAHDQLGRQQFFLLAAIGGAWLLAFEVARRVRATEQVSAARGDLERARERVRLLEEVRRERDHIAALQALTHALTAAVSFEEVRDAVHRHPGAVLVGAELDLAMTPSGAVDAGPSARPPGGAELPVVSRGVTVGALRIAAADDTRELDDTREFDDAQEGEEGVDENTWVRARTVVDLVVQAVERIRLDDAEREQRQLLVAINAILADLTAAATVKDVAATVERHAMAAVGAEALALAVRDDESTQSLQVLVALATDADANLGLVAGDLIDVAAETPIAAAARGRVPVFDDHARPDAITGWCAAVPLTAGGQPLGALWIRRPEPWTEPLRLRARSLASFVADALARARRSQADHEIALVLQRALMPQPTGTIAGARIAGHYQPATGMLEVGGDWYDVLPHASGETTLVIGDVVGHGLLAASVMGQLSSAARALSATTTTDPAEIVAGLEQMATRTPGAESSTVVCATYSPPATLSYCRAGHPPPLVRLPSGEVLVLDEGDGPLCFTSRQRSQHVVTLPPGALVVLYTDGLIEWRGTTIDRRLADLRTVIAGIDPADPHQAVADIVAAMTAEVAASDDIAILTLLVDPTALSA